MKKIKNGFTFVELLAVITIIGILSLIALPTIEKVTKDSKEKVYQTQLNNIILALKNWASDNKEYLPTSESEALTITLGTLKADGYIDYELKNPKTNKCFDNEMYLKITKEKKNYDYSIDLDSIKESDVCEVDGDSPIIILNGTTVENVEINSVYIDKGVSAEDKDGNDITSSVVTVITGSDNVVDTSKLGNQYVINYSVTDNERTVKTSRTIKIVDTKAPELVIPGNVTIGTTVTSLDLLAGVSTADNSGEAIEISTKNNIVYGIPGKYTITYSVSDSSGNTNTKTRIVRIVSGV